MTKAVINKHYQHYKGDEYSVIAIGKHTETGQELVVYRQECKNQHGPVGTVWIRPKDMWEAKVDYNDRTVNRFTLI